MTWQEYYEKVWDWAPTTTIQRMSQLSSFGPSEEVTEVILEIAFYDEKGATRLLKKATDAGVKFTGEQLVDLCLSCEDAELERAIRSSCDKFTNADIEMLYGCYDDDLVVEVAKKAKQKLPKELAENVVSDDVDEAYKNKISRMSREQLLGSYDYVLSCLYHAHEKMKLALQLSISDVWSKKRSISVVKHACLVEAEPFINEARRTLEEIESQVKDKVSVRNTRLNMGKAIVFHDVFGDGLFTDWMVQRRIQKIISAIESAYKEVQGLKKKL